MDLYTKIFEVLFPVFFVIGIGYYLGKKNPKIDTNFITNFAGNIGTPAMIFYTVTTTGVTLAVFTSYFFYALVMIGGFSIVGLILLFILKRDLSMELPPMILPNTGNMGIPICLSAYGTQGLGVASAIASVIILFHFTLGVFLAKKKFSFDVVLNSPPVYSIIISVLFLYFNLDNNSSISPNQSTDLSNVTNEEMEQVIKLNPDILPMRIALANRYFESYDYSNALIHFMYVAENTDDIDLKSYSLAQIGWMVYESGDELTSMSYINEAVRLSPGSLLGSTYKGIIYVQNPNTRSEGIKILESLKSNTSLPEDDLKIINEILVIYEN